MACKPWFIKYFVIIFLYIFILRKNHILYKIKIVHKNVEWKNYFPEFKAYSLKAIIFSFMLITQDSYTYHLLSVTLSLYSLLNIFQSMLFVLFSSMKTTLIPDSSATNPSKCYVDAIIIHSRKIWDGRVYLTGFQFDVAVGLSL